MKSNIILKSTDREIFGVTIRQNTKEGFLSVSDLQKAYEKARWEYGWTDRRINDILGNATTRDRIFELLSERGIIKTTYTAFMEMVEKEGITKVLKGLKLYKTTGKGENKSVMCDPYIWVLLAMELNPKLWAKTVIFITDTLIFDRISAGNEYMPMNSAIKSIINEPNYSEYARLINKKVFGKHETGMRNLASSNDLRKITEIEKTVISAIENKWIKDEKGLLDFLNKK